MNQIVSYIEQRLQVSYSPDEARALAFWTAEELTHLSRTELIVDSACKDTQNISNIEIFIQRLLKKEPIQYIFGHTEWCGLHLKVNSFTLIPRPETYELVALVNHVAAPHAHMRVIDIGTGSGCIAIALAKQHPKWDVTAIDYSEEILQVAQYNAEYNGANIVFKKTDILYDEIDTFDYIISNPPYIRNSERTAMQKNVLDYEPHSALFVPDNNPLLFYHRMASIHKAKQLFFEINESLAHEVRDMLIKEGYTNCHIYKDSYGKDRFIHAATPN